jgi:glycosyltransferase involved in cell wall biosynthesis
MGKPVIASDHGGAVETITHGLTGYRVVPGDASALAAAIDQVLAASAAERRSVGIAARTSVLKTYTTAAMQRATIAVYRELVPWDG